MPAFLEDVWYAHQPESLPRKLALAPLDALCGLYGAAVRTRGWLYDRGLLRPERVEGLKVVSVGNVNVGGTGKTPAVIHLAQVFAEQGAQVAVLSRGYGRHSAQDQQVTPQSRPEDVGDEPLLIARRCAQVTVLTGADRVGLARRARAEHQATVALLDDGLQHRRLHRDVDIVVVDAKAGFGNHRLLPRGPLREPLTALERASLLWVRLDASDQVPEPLRSRPHVVVRQRVEGVVDPGGALHPSERLRGQRVLALAGIARPARFQRTLESLGADVQGTAFFEDHHPFTEDELANLHARAQAAGALVVTTEKDAVRIRGVDVWQVRWTTEVLAGHEHLRRLVTDLVPPAA